MDVPQPVSRRDAHAIGLTDAVLGSRDWRRLRRGFYVPTATVEALDPVQRHLLLAVAAVRASSDQAVVSHASAAAMHGLPVWGLALTRVHLTRDRKSGARKSRTVELHGGPLSDDDVVAVGDFAVTTVARTVVDIARSAPFAVAVSIGDAALSRGLTDPPALDRQVARAVHRYGVSAARAVVAALDGRSESPGESRLRIALADPRIPAPQPQATILDSDGRFVARVDLLLAELGVIVEFDGKIKYGRQLRGSKPVEQVVYEEKLREDRLRALGWIVVRVTWHDLEDHTSLINRILAAANLGRRQARTGTWIGGSRNSQTW